jgi:hypothetical protein
MSKIYLIFQFFGIENFANFFPKNSKIIQKNILKHIFSNFSQFDVSTWHKLSLGISREFYIMWMMTHPLNLVNRYW